MKIFINDTAIDFRLENEQTAGMVWNELSSWLARAGQRVLTLSVDAEPVDVTAEAWRATPVDRIGVLRVVVESARQEQIDSLETIATYLELLARVLHEGTPEQLDGVLEELPYVERGLAVVAPDLDGILGPVAEQVSASDRVDAARRSASLAGLVRERQQELLDPVGTTASAIPVLRALVGAFGDIPVMLQRDERRAAMETIARFSVAATRLMRTLPILMERMPELRDETIENVALPEAISQLNAHLHEVQDAFERSDLVLLGDLLEYELQPRLEALTDRVERNLRRDHG